MYQSQIDAHARSIEELTGEEPTRGRYMYIEDVRKSTGIIDDSQINTRRTRNPLAGRPVTICWDSINSEIMAGNYASGWQQPRENQAVGQQVIFSAQQKRQHEQQYQYQQPQQQYQQPQYQQSQQQYQQPQQQYQQPQARAQPHPHGRRPIGRYGSRPSSDSKELVGGNSFNPKGNRAADMFKKAKDRVDQFTVDDESINPHSLQRAREGEANEYDPLQTKGRGRPQARPAAKPAPRPVSQPARPPPQSSSFVSDYDAPQQQPPQAQRQQQPAQRQQQPAQRQQQPAQRQQQPQRQPQQQPIRQPQPSGSAFATDYAPPAPQSRPAQTRPMNPATKGPQYDARTGQHAKQPPPVTGCSWNKDSATKRFHAGVEPYQENYNRSAQGWAGTYQAESSDYDPHAPKKSPNYGAAPKLDLIKGGPVKRDATFGNYNKSARGWNPAGLQDDDADNLYSANRQSMSSLAANFEQPKPQYRGQSQRAPQQAARPAQRPAQQQQQQRTPAAPTYGAGSSWGGMLESDDL